MPNLVTSIQLLTKSQAGSFEVVKQILEFSQC